MKNREEELSNLLLSSQGELELLKRKAIQTPLDDEKIRKQMSEQIQRAEETWSTQKSEL
jgi:hypothetical protein